MTHNYKRHGTTTLFAALSVLNGTVISRYMQLHLRSEFNAVQRPVPAEKPIHAVLDNYATHKHPKVLAWLGRHPRWTFYFTPTSASWLNAVGVFFFTLMRSGTQAVCCCVGADQPGTDGADCGAPAAVQLGGHFVALAKCPDDPVAQHEQLVREPQDARPVGDHDQAAPRCFRPAIACTKAASPSRTC